MKSNFFRHFNRYTLTRVALDFVMVHLSMLVAIQVCLVWYARTSPVPASKLLDLALGYYGLFAWAFAPIFPIVFALCGFYTRLQHYDEKHKMIAVVRGVALSVLIFLAANFFLFRQVLLTRGAAIAFSVLLFASILARRGLRSFLVRYLPSNTPTPSAETNDTVLVVGGAGYIGCLLVRKLLDSGAKVRVLDNLTYGDEAIRDVLSHPNLELMVGDCRNIRSVVSAMEGVKALVHLAAIVGDPACEQDQKAALEINYAATRVLIEIAKGRGVDRFVFASSCSVYGATDHLSSEESPTVPISLYARTKVDSERALLLSGTRDFHPTVLRFATVFGLSHRPRFDLVVNLLTAKAFQDHTITIFNGEQWRPFIHASDAAQAVLEVLHAPVNDVSGEIFNVGDSRLNHTLTEVGTMVSEQLSGTRVEHVDSADKRNYRVTFDKIRGRIGFQCGITVQHGIAELKQAFEAGLIQDYNDLRYSNLRYLKAAGTPANTDEVDGRIMAAFVSPESVGAAAGD